MTNVVIASAARTAVGSFSGSFANTPAHELGAAVLEAVVARAGIDKSEVSETILGQVLTAGQGQNPARQAHIHAGLSMDAAAWGINQVCGSGLRAVALAAQHIQLGDAAIVAAGGQESMSLSTHCAHLRAGVKMGDVSYIDTMIRDGLWDAFNGYHMGQTAENVANQWQISRDMQDEFAVASQNKAEAAQKAGKFKDEIAPVTVSTRKGDVVVSEDAVLYRIDRRRGHQVLAELIGLDADEVGRLQAGTVLYGFRLARVGRRPSKKGQPDRRAWLLSRVVEGSEDADDGGTAISGLPAATAPAPSTKCGGGAGVKPVSCSAAARLIAGILVVRAVGKGQRHAALRLSRTGPGPSRGARLRIGALPLQRQPLARCHHLGARCQLDSGRRHCPHRDALGVFAVRAFAAQREDVIPGFKRLSRDRSRRVARATPGTTGGARGRIGARPAQGGRASRGDLRRTGCEGQ